MAMRAACRDDRFVGAQRLRNETAAVEVVDIQRMQRLDAGLDELSPAGSR
jgi:hypothetical protein